MKMKQTIDCALMSGRTIRLFKLRLANMYYLFEGRYQKRDMLAYPQLSAGTKFPGKDIRGTEINDK